MSRKMNFWYTWMKLTIWIPWMGDVDISNNCLLGLSYHGLFFFTKRCKTLGATGKISTLQSLIS